ncbi:MAG TPA: GTP-binding protein [Acidobacteriota bacterium]|nr:GTP-binding protein [Acidobacteriota bacterium]
MTSTHYFPVVFSGHVDHGKSSLIGRILFDTNSISPDRIEEVKKISAQLGRDFEFCFLLDYMQEEREQNVTIDITETFFSTPKRDFVIIDAPGHREFTKNMVTGASRAEAAVLVIDVNEGICEQTRRHAYILSLLGIRQILVAVNKMDLCQFSKSTFDHVAKSVEELFKTLGVVPQYIIPISATGADNVLHKSANCAWYTGPTVIEALETLSSSKSISSGALCLPIQDVYVVEGKRVYVGTVGSGTITMGQMITVLPSGQSSTVKAVREFANPLKKEASAGESIGIELTDKLFVERGNIIVSESSHLQPVTTFEATIFWLSPEKFTIGDELLLRCATQEMMCKISSIHTVMNSSTLAQVGGELKHISTHEVARVSVTCVGSVVIDVSGVFADLSHFVLERNSQVVAGGIVLKA